MSEYKHEGTKDYPEIEDNYRKIWVGYLRKPIDEFLKVANTNAVAIKPIFMTGEWFHVYNFIEFILVHTDSLTETVADLRKAINSVLQANNSGYYLHKDQFIPITNHTEVKEISDLEKNTLKYKLKGIKVHLETALKSLSLKPEPDLRNSIKESISMVGTIARFIEPSNDLSKALYKISEKGKIDKQLLEGFKKLYHFTSGEGGIRHELMDTGTNLDFETARYFLISCSAFTNYLISEGIKTGIIVNQTSKE